MNPPNLRYQEAVHGEMCRVCVYLTNRFCTKYQLTVEPNAECDSFESIFLQGGRQYAEP